MKTFIGEANGRVNLIGEHTDYNGGFVLPTAIPQKTRVTLTTRGDQSVHLRSSGAREVVYELGQEKKQDEWMDYLAGATSLLLKDGFRLGGMDLSIESNVPEGSGLSSSAALEVAFLKSVREAFSLDLNDVAIAKLGQRIENEFVGARVGIMDQMACALAKTGQALFLDTQSMDYEQIQIPLDQCDLVVINSGIAHRLSDGGYNERRAQCEEACAKLGIGFLREFSLRDLSKISSLPDKVMRRARHVITENDRVLKAVDAIRAKDLKTLGQLFYQSHASMRDDFEVSIPEIDQMVELLSKTEGVYGARLTGGGFGGSVVALTQKGLGKKIASTVSQKYDALTGEKSTVLVPEN